MKILITILCIGGPICAGIVLAKYLEKHTREQATMDELDGMLAEILSGCMEAFCEDCDCVLAQGTHPFHDDVAAVAYNHGELYDHAVKVRSWAE